MFGYCFIALYNRSIEFEKGLLPGFYFKYKNTFDFSTLYNHEKYCILTHRILSF